MPIANGTKVYIRADCSKAKLYGRLLGEVVGVMTISPGEGNRTLQYWVKFSNWADRYVYLFEDELEVIER